MREVDLEPIFERSWGVDEEASALEELEDETRGGEMTPAPRLGGVNSRGSRFTCTFSLLVERERPES